MQPTLANIAMKCLTLFNKNAFYRNNEAKIVKNKNIVKAWPDENKKKERYFLNLLNTHRF